MMRAYQAELRRTQRVQADVAEAVAAGYAGCRAEDGPANLQRFLEARRK